MNNRRNSSKRTPSCPPQKTKKSNEILSHYVYRKTQEVMTCYCKQLATHISDAYGLHPHFAIPPWAPVCVEEEEKPTRRGSIRRSSVHSGPLFAGEKAIQDQHYYYLTRALDLQSETSTKHDPLVQDECGYTTKHDPLHEWIEDHNTPLNREYQYTSGNSAEEENQKKTAIETVVETVDSDSWLLYCGYIS
eukprot:GHVR01167943.1.p1 GENE.GHVR01167943.1~~GHVR01167943.1.p1  ORF type:complete len:191 (-),score=49.35 GHVR01167943.1:45-617(-)